MRPVTLHEPGVPQSDEPPASLVRASDALLSPLVRQSGITTTHDGRWALYVTVPDDASVPIAEVEAQAEGFPVVYEAQPLRPVRAGPAFPKSRKPKAI